MSTTASDQPGVDKPRFRDALRDLPGRVWIISFGILVNQVGNFLPVFIVLYLTNRGYSGIASGFVLAASGLGKVLGNVVGGYLADKIGRRWTIVLSAVTTSGLTVFVPFLDALPLIVVLVGLIGVTSQVYRPAAAALLVDSVSGDQQRLAAFGVFRFTQNVGAAVGGVIGGMLANTSYTELFLGNAAACLLFGLVIAALLRDVPEQPSDQDDAHAQTGRSVGYREALADRVLVRFLVMTVFAEFVYIQSTVGLPLHVNDVGLSERDFGFLIGLNGLLVLTLELPITAVVSRIRPEYVLAIGNLITGAGLALTGLADGMTLLLGTVLVWTLGEMITSSVSMAYLGSLAPPHMVGRYQGLYGVAYTTGTGISPLIGGALYSLGSWVLWGMVGVAGVLSAQFSLPRRGAASKANKQETIDD
ncbi:MFS transporter [Streptomyces sp. NPDC032472]|uniref:MDR family MFS transporter n=1 Tax=Streptomyces sp. NPDC032472 TaxID=3155018 RepID=UPI0033D02F34